MACNGPKGDQQYLVCYFESDRTYSVIWSDNPAIESKLEDHINVIYNGVSFEGKIVGASRKYVLTIII